MAISSARGVDQLDATIVNPMPLSHHAFTVGVAAETSPSPVSEESTSTSNPGEVVYLPEDLLKTSAPLRQRVLPFVADDVEKGGIELSDLFSSKDDGGESHKGHGPSFVADEADLSDVAPSYLELLLVILGIKKKARYFSMSGGSRRALLFAWTVRILLAGSMLWIGVIFPSSAAAEASSTDLGRQQRIALYSCAFLRFEFNSTQFSFNSPIPEVPLSRQSITSIPYAEWAPLAFPPPQEYPPLYLCILNRLFMGLLAPIYGSFGLACYLWLFVKARDSKSLLRTHRDKVTKEIDFIVPIIIVYAVGATLVMLAIVSATSDWSHGPSGGGSQQIANPSVRLYENSALIFCGYPMFAILGLFYAETTRLRLVSEDYCELLRKTEFDFAILGPAYMELLAEWESAQQKFGDIIAFSFVIIALVIFGVSFIVYGAFAYSVAFGQVVTWQMWVPVFMFSPYLLVPYMALIYALGRSNSIGDSVADAIKESILREQGVQSLKLLALEQWRPCGLTLFGRRVSIWIPVDYPPFKSILLCDTR